MRPNNWNNCESAAAIGRSPKILIDNGHGVETPGKRSPDGVLREYAWNRLIAGRVVSALTDLGHDAALLVPEPQDIPLPERCRRVNEWCRQLGKDNIILISIHANAAGKGDRWYDATGWCAYTTRGDTRADALATCLYEAAKLHLPGQRIRTDYTDGDPDLEADFYILRRTLPPAVLVENFFIDNRPDGTHDDLTFLESAPSPSGHHRDFSLRSK